MCLIIYSPNAELPDRKVFERANLDNPDGIGVMSQRGVKKWQGANREKAAWKYISKLSKDGLPFGVHFRWQTHGDLSLANVHPHKCADGTLVMHNGVISVTAKRDWTMTGAPTAHTETRSDTSLFCRDYLTAVPDPSSPFHDGFMAMVEHTIGSYNKFLLYFPDADAFALANEASGSWDKKSGCWYSNRHSFASTATVRDHATGAWYDPTKQAVTKYTNGNVWAGYGREGYAGYGSYLSEKDDDNRVTDIAERMSRYACEDWCQYDDDLAGDDVVTHPCDLCGMPSEYYSLDSNAELCDDCLSDCVYDSQQFTGTISGVVNDGK